jgi:hypothetical protein
MPGLGKSFLGNAIAYDALPRGIDAERVTASRSSDHSAHNNRADASHRAISSVPLLAWTTTAACRCFKRKSFEWLFAVINERTSPGSPPLHHKPDARAASQRYDDRFMAGFATKTTTQVLTSRDNLHGK